MFKGKTEAATFTKRIKTKAALNSESIKEFLLTHPQLTRMAMGIGISAAIGVLLMIMSASPEQAFAWRPIKGQPMVD